MHSIGGRFKAAGAMSLVLAFAPTSLHAQSANDWRLPGATVRPAPPGSQGPVDRDNPVVTTTAPRQQPAPTPAPSAAPSPAATVPAASQPAAQPRPAASQPAARQQAVPAPRQTGVAPPPTTALPTGGASAPATALPSAGPVANAAPADFPALPPATSAPTDTASSGWYWPWIAGAAALLALIFAGLWWRRSREPAIQQITFERPVVVPVERTPEPQTAAAPEAPAIAAAAIMPEPQLGAALSEGIGITLEARRMSASLMATTLNYVLKLTNNGSEPLSELAIEGDMISAHAALPAEARIANDNHRLENKHSLVTLAPGESAEFTGDFRLPLASLTPIRSGDAAYFVPLARLRVRARTPRGMALTEARTFVVGELPDDPAAALKPFRLDLGPRTYSRLGQRAVN